MVRIIDHVLDGAARNPGAAVAWILGTAAGILIAYWTASGVFGDPQLVLGLAAIIGAIVFVSRHMSHRAKTEEYAALEAREEIAYTDALYKHRSGQTLTPEDVAALRMRNQGRMS